MKRSRLLLAIRTIAVTYRAALRHRPSDTTEWFDEVRQRADEYLDDVEARAEEVGPLDAEVEFQLRVAREGIRSADEDARSGLGPMDGAEAVEEAREPGR